MVRIIIFMVMAMVLALHISTASAAYNGTIMYLADSQIIAMNPNNGATRVLMNYTAGNITVDYAYDAYYSIIYFVTNDGNATKVDIFNAVTGAMVGNVTLEMPLKNVQYESLTASFIGCIMKGNQLQIYRVSRVTGRGQMIATYDTMGRPLVRDSSGLDYNRRLYMTTVGGFGQVISIITVNLATDYVTAVHAQTILQPAVYDIGTGGFIFGIEAQRGKFLIDVTRSDVSNTVIPSMGGVTFGIASSNIKDAQTIFACITVKEATANQVYLSIYSTAGGWQLYKWPMGVSAPTRYLAYFPSIPPQ